MNKDQNNTCIHIETLGGLTISSGEQTISDYSQQSKKPWILLEYLIVFRRKNISSNELIEAIWGEESGANPAGSLKTLLFRARKLLEPLGIPTHKLIVQQQGSYAWTKEIETILDIDLFDKLCKTALSPDKDLKVCKEAGFKAAALYKGDFLPQASSESWVVPVSAYYHSLYLKMIHRLLEICFLEQSYQIVIALCRQAIAVENLDEELHYYLIHALYKSSSPHSAMEHYIHITDMFYNEYAITPSDKLKDLYKVIQDGVRPTVTDITAIQTDFQKGDSHKGAFFCEYTVFKDIYLLVSRSIERTKDSIFLCLLTVTDERGIAPPPALLASTMGELRNSIRTSLRKGDVFSRYSTNQFIILLPSANRENGIKVLTRVIGRFHTSYSHKNVHIAYSLQAVHPSPASEKGGHIESEDHL